MSLQVFDYQEGRELGSFIRFERSLLGVMDLSFEFNAVLPFMKVLRLPVVLDAAILVLAKVLALLGSSYLLLIPGLSGA